MRIHSLLESCQGQNRRHLSRHSQPERLGRPALEPATSKLSEQCLLAFVTPAMKPGAAALAHLRLHKNRRASIQRSTGKQQERVNHQCQAAQRHRD